MDGSPAVEPDCADPESVGRREEWSPRLRAEAAAITPARLFTGRVGSSYPTATALRLRSDHAAARDAVTQRLDTSPAAMTELTGGAAATVVTTLARDRAEFVRRPDLGRRLSPAGLDRLAGLSRGADLQLVLGDGLAARALTEQAPELLRALTDGARRRGWTVGELVVVTNCRVGVMNDIGEVLDPRVVVLLIGERPGLATAASLSAYLAFQPRRGHDDSRRNLVSNIHPRGLSATVAASRVLGLAEAMRVVGAGGVAVKEVEHASFESRSVQIDRQ